MYKIIQGQQPCKCRSINNLFISGYGRYFIWALFKELSLYKPNDCTFFPKQITMHFKNVKYGLFFVAIKTPFDHCQFRIWILTITDTQSQFHARLLQSHSDSPVSPSVIAALTNWNLWGESLCEYLSPLLMRCKKQSYFWVAIPQIPLTATNFS